MVLCLTHRRSRAAGAIHLLSSTTKPSNPARPFVDTALLFLCGRSGDKNPWFVHFKVDDCCFAWFVKKLQGTRRILDCVSLFSTVVSGPRARSSPQPFPTAFADGIPDRVPDRLPQICPTFPDCFRSRPAPPRNIINVPSRIMFPTAFPTYSRSVHRPFPAPSRPVSPKMIPPFRQTTVSRPFP